MKKILLVLMASLLLLSACSESSAKKEERLQTEVISEVDDLFKRLIALQRYEGDMDLSDEDLDHTGSEGKPLGYDKKDKKDKETTSDTELSREETSWAERLGKPEVLSIKFNDDFTKASAVVKVGDLDTYDLRQNMYKYIQKGTVLSDALEVGESMSPEQYGGALLSFQEALKASLSGDREKAGRHLWDMNFLLPLWGLNAYMTDFSKGSIKIKEFMTTTEMNMDFTYNKEAKKWVLDFDNPTVDGEPKYETEVQYLNTEVFDTWEDYKAVWGILWEEEVESVFNEMLDFFYEVSQNPELLKELQEDLS